MTDSPPPGERIAKVLSRGGIASRRTAERMIAEGRVSVSGRVIDSPALNVTDADRIAVDGTPLAPPEPARLWLYHKPAGLVTSEADEQGRETVFDALPEELPRVMSVGRLDLTSEGLLLLTNDGALKRRLELPSTGWLRRYRVRIRGSLSEAKLDQLRQGITVEGVAYQPMTVQFDRQQGANAWLTVGLREGKNREIRRAMEAVGAIVNRLIRVSYGPFQLGNLAPGAVEEVRRKVLRDQLGLEAGDGAPETAARPKGPRPKRADAPARSGNGGAAARPGGSGGAKRSAGPGGAKRAPGAGEAKRPSGPGDAKRPRGPGEATRPTGPGGPRRPSGPGGPKRPGGGPRRG